MGGAGALKRVEAGSGLAASLPTTRRHAGRSACLRRPRSQVGGSPLAAVRLGGRGRAAGLRLLASSPDVEAKDAEADAAASSIIDDLKNAAMFLHTKDQAASGGQERKERPAFEPTRGGYLRYLVDSRSVFSTMETIVQEKPELSELKDNGLERSSALDKDIAYLEGLDVVPAGYEGDESPGSEYAAYLRTMSEENLPGFLCHYYNTYFAHTAGGRMIGKAVSDKILDGAKLDFYHDYPEAVSKLSRRVKTSLEEIAADWSEEEKGRCVDETKAAFKYAGLVMRQMTIKE